MNFNLSQVVIHCQTVEQAKAVLNQLCMLGYRYGDKRKIVDDSETGFINYEDRTVYYPYPDEMRIYYGNVNSVDSRERTIIEASDFLMVFNGLSDKEKPKKWRCNT